MVPNGSNWYYYLRFYEKSSAWLICFWFNQKITAPIKKNNTWSTLHTLQPVWHIKLNLRFIFGIEPFTLACIYFTYEVDWVPVRYISPGEEVQILYLLASMDAKRNARGDETSSDQRVIDHEICKNSTCSLKMEWGKVAFNPLQSAHPIAHERCLYINIYKGQFPPCRKSQAKSALKKTVIPDCQLVRIYYYIYVWFFITYVCLRFVFLLCHLLVDKLSIKPNKR